MTTKMKGGSQAQHSGKINQTKRSKTHGGGGHNSPDSDLSQFVTYEKKEQIKATNNEKANNGKNKGVTGGGQRGVKEGSLSVGSISTLTPTQREIFNLITKDHLTPKQVSIKRKLSLSKTYKHIRKLKEKGYLNPLMQGGQNGGVLVTPPTPEGAVNHLVRLHGMQWKIDIKRNSGADERYFSKIGTHILIDGNTVRCNKESIEIYPKDGMSFFGKNDTDATIKGWHYYLNLISILENDLKLLLVTDRGQNIHLVKAHYAEINNELATECEKTGDKIQIRTPEDGKVWFVIDNSFDLLEAETVHSKTAAEDMAKIKPVLNDIRTNNPGTLTEIVKAIGRLEGTVERIGTKVEGLAHENLETASGLKGVVMLMSKAYQSPQPPQQESEKTKPEYSALEGYV